MDHLPKRHFTDASRLDTQDIGHSSKGRIDRVDQRQIRRLMLTRAGAGGVKLSVRVQNRKRTGFYKDDVMPEIAASIGTHWSDLRTRFLRFPEQHGQALPRVRYRWPPQSRDSLDDSRQIR